MSKKSATLKCRCLWSCRSVMAMSSANHTQPKQMFQFRYVRVVSNIACWSGVSTCCCQSHPYSLGNGAGKFMRFTSVITVSLTKPTIHISSQYSGKICRHSIVVITPRCHRGNEGSIPSGGAKPNFSKNLDKVSSMLNFIFHIIMNK